LDFYSSLARFAGSLHFSKIFEAILSNKTLKWVLKRNCGHIEQAEKKGFGRNGIPTSVGRRSPFSRERPSKHEASLKKGFRTKRKISG
jgi:hypothetical protein